MFDSEEELDEEIEKIFKIHNTYSDMDTNVIIYIVLTFGVLVMLLGCCMRRNGGSRLRSQPDPPSRPPPGFEPHYPQQQYNPPHPGPVVTGVAYPVAQVATSYPAPAPYPTYPTGMPVPSIPGHYPQGYVPGRYPAAGAPYPTASYPTAPSAPDASAMPPTYEQAVCARPYAPHAQ